MVGILLLLLVQMGACEMGEMAGWGGGCCSNRCVEINLRDIMLCMELKESFMQALHSSA